MSHLLLSFQSGIVRPMLASTERPGTMGKYPAEAEARCANMGETGAVIDKETYRTLGKVVRVIGGYRFVAEEVPA